MPGVGLDPNFLKQQQEVMRANALKNMKDKPPKQMSSGKLFAIIVPIFIFLVIILIIFGGV